jgi:hypothetical protein
MGKIEIGDFMPRLIRRLLLLSVVCAGGAFGQSVEGTFAQIAFGGSWQTTFTLVNMDATNLANVTLNFFQDGATPGPLTVPVQGFGNTASFAFTILPSNSTNVVLSSTNPIVTQGWASMTVGAGTTVRGQGSFRFLLPGGQISEAVVPLNSTPTFCILFCAPTSNILIPFDNTNGVYITSIALANTMSTNQNVTIEFDDQSNIKLASDTLNLTPMQHKAFRTIDLYPQTVNKKGVIRISDTTDNGVPINLPTPAPVIALGLLSNATNAVTTIMPITQ